MVSDLIIYDALFFQLKQIKWFCRGKTTGVRRQTEACFGFYVCHFCCRFKIPQKYTISVPYIALYTPVHQIGVEFEFNYITFFGAADVKSWCQIPVAVFLHDKMINNTVIIFKKWDPVHNVHIVHTKVFLCMSRDIFCWVSQMHFGFCVCIVVVVVGMPI